MHVQERVLIPPLRTELIFAETTMRHLSLQSLFRKELKKISANIRRLRELFPAQVPSIFFLFLSFPLIYFLFVCLFPYADMTFVCLS